MAAKQNMSKARIVLLFLGFCSTLIMVFIVALGENRSVAVSSNSDYATNLYVAGDMVAHGQGAFLYPPLSSNTVHGQVFGLYANELMAHVRGLAHPDESSTVLFFIYPPVVALMMVPLASLPLPFSLGCWQLLCLLALIASASFVRKLPGTHASLFTLCVAAGLFWPLINVFIFGQTSLILGLLPMAAGYYLWQRDKYFWAGLCWSVLGLKPQLAISVVIIVAALSLAALLRKDKDELKEPALIAAGGATGLFLLSLVAAVVLGFQSFPLWLHAVELGGKAFASPESVYWQYHLFFSLPTLLLIAIPQKAWLAYRMNAYLVGLAIMISGVFMVLKQLSCSTDKQRSRDLAIIYSVPFIMLSAPHVLIYDLVMLLLPAWILLFRIAPTLEEPRKAFLIRLGGLILLAAFNCYFWVISEPGVYPPLRYQISILLALAVYTILLWTLLRPIKGSQTQVG